MFIFIITTTEYTVTMGVYIEIQVCLFSDFTLHLNFCKWKSKKGVEPGW